MFTLTKVDDSELHGLCLRGGSIPSISVRERLRAKEGIFLSLDLELGVCDRWVRFQFIVDVFVASNPVEEDVIELEV